MKMKKLRRKIEQLEKRLQKGPQKLARLRRKLQEAETAKALKAARKSAVRATAAKRSFEQKADAKRPKKKLNLSPERRAQLSAAMKARWEAKRASSENSSTWINQNSPSPPETTSDGI